MKATAAETTEEATTAAEATITVAETTKVPAIDPLFWQHLLALEAPPATCRALIEGLGKSLLAPEVYLLHHPTLSESERTWLTQSAKFLPPVLESGARILVEDDYPETLRQVLSFVSPGLFIQGDPACLNAPTVGIVGTRDASPYGRACAQKFAEALANAGVTVVSGGALGIDGAAHKGALAVGGKTAAVFAGGIDKIYPAVHGDMFKQITEQGCLISQFGAGARPSDYKFLARNVTIAALSQALLVIQAPVKSGSLTTATASAEMGREVFVVPANIDAIEFRGSFNLLRDGATLVYHPDQILESLGIARPTKKEAPVDISPLGQRIVDILSADPLDPERIVERTGLSAGEVLSELTMLELDGVVLRAPGGYTKKL
jgi:DNA processing protein